MQVSLSASVFLPFSPRNSQNKERGVLKETGHAVGHAQHHSDNRIRLEKHKVFAYFSMPRFRHDPYPRPWFYAAKPTSSIGHLHHPSFSTNLIFHKSQNSHFRFVVPIVPSLVLDRIAPCPLVEAIIISSLCAMSPLCARCRRTSYVKSTTRLVDFGRLCLNQCSRPRTISHELNPSD